MVKILPKQDTLTHVRTNTHVCFKSYRYQSLVAYCETVFCFLKLLFTSANCTLANHSFFTSMLLLEVVLRFPAYIKPHVFFYNLPIHLFKASATSWKEEFCPF